MELLRKEEIKSLANDSTGPCISIFLPTHRGGVEIKQGPIRLKNLLREAEQQLLVRKMRPAEVKELLEPAEQLTEDFGFWQHQGEGLAVFLTSRFARWYRLPVRFDELVVVAGRFHLKPLLRLLTEDGLFYLLALSQNEVRLFQCTRHGVREMELPAGTPASLDQVLQVSGLERQLQVHTAGGGPLYHGHGAASEDAKQDLREFFRLLDKGLREVLRDQRAPLVLAGVEYLFPLYREANTYPHLVSAGVPGNPQGKRAEELREAAWAVVEPVFRKERESARQLLDELAGSARASLNLREIVPAACQGRVDRLFVAVGVQQWGSFNQGTQKVRISRSYRVDDVDLLDLAALQTLQQGGAVYAVTEQQVPGGGKAAAIFRY